MKAIIVFLKKYYGAVIGGIVGLVLISLGYYVSAHQTDPFSIQLSRILEFLVPPVEVVMNLFGALLFLMWFVLPIAMVIWVVTHFIITILLYGFIGFLIHYLILRLAKKIRKVDKNNKI